MKNNDIVWLHNIFVLLVNLLHISTATLCLIDFCTVLRDCSNWEFDVKALAEKSYLVELLAKRKIASKRQLQQLTGKLKWACTVVHWGLTFLRRIIDCLNLLKIPSAKFLFTPEFRKDLF